jgi:uncharacterized protein
MEENSRTPTGRHLRLALTGSHGLLGSALIPALRSHGHEAIRLVRRPARADDEVVWDPSAEFPASSLDGLDAVIHLAGENIANGRWTEARKRAIRESRVEGTRRLAKALASLSHPPQVLLSASAVGYYGDRGAELVSEEAPAGRGFLADVCQEWEAATEPARRGGVRVATLRFGVVLTPAGGALQKMLRPFRWGVGGRIGDGRQFMSWITLADAIAAIEFCLTTPALQGPVNLTAPAVTNAEFTSALAAALRRPALLPVPRAAVRLFFGEMGEALLLASTRAHPSRLLAAGYTFQFPDLQPALRHLLGRPAGD